MKNIISLIVFFCICHYLSSQSVGVGSSVFTPDASAMLEVRATNKGVLIPRVTLTGVNDATTIASPATSLLVFNIGGALSAGYYYNAGTPVSPLWVRLLDSREAWLLTGNSGTNPTTHFLGTTDAQHLVIRTNSLERMRVTSDGNVGIGITVPTERLHVYNEANAHKSSIYGVARQTSTSTDYSNVGVYGFARGANSTWGNAIGVAGVADKSNSWRAMGVYASLGTGLPASYVNTAVYADGANQGAAGLFMGGRVGIGTTNPSFDLHVTGNTRIEQFLAVGNPTTTATTRRGYKMFYFSPSTPLSVQNGYVNSPSLGQITIPPGASSITIRRIIWVLNGYHQDGDEQHGAMVRIGSNDYAPIYETANSGYMPIDWENTAEVNINLTTAQDVYLRLYDASDLFDDRFYVLNAHIIIFYEYTVAAQTGDILASGNVYANNIYSIAQYGDLAEHLPVLPLEGVTPEPGMIVSFFPGSDGLFTLSTQSSMMHVAGVISHDPTVLLNNPGMGEPVAFTGRVRVLIDPQSEPIRSGDFITVSNRPGYGRKTTSSGYVIGYAITNQKPGEKYVEVLLQPGRFVMIDGEPVNREDLNTSKPGRSTTISQ